ncbi:MAG: hypothetical protein O3C63_09240 [Cyanobacteria bacterium]|nr:hypothetical protein [Cyanobacteriota bacterium]MDA1020329.1 hypothetical protein [Cyanobacteriota bacterium]
MSLVGNSRQLTASIDETGDTKVLVPGEKLNQQITDFVDAIFRIYRGQKPQNDNFYINLTAAADEDDEAIGRNLQSDFHIIEKAYLFLYESVQEGQLDLITKKDMTYAKLGSVNGIRLLANCEEVVLLAFLDPDADLEHDDPQIAIINYKDGTQSMVRFLSNDQFFTLTRGPVD